MGGVTQPKRIATAGEFREAVAHAKLVITDSANGATYHPDPDGCGHIQEHSFNQKVIDNCERNGQYFRVDSLREARERWPDVRACRSSACSSAAR
jgi:hypothetical protein